MKKLIYPLLILSSTITHSYELVNFSSSRVRDISEILTETNMSISMLANYKCENPERFELFANTTIQNMAKDSLKIIDKSGEVFSYTEGKLIDENFNEVLKPNDKFLKLALKTLKRLETVSQSKRLIEELQTAPLPFYIKLGGNRYQPNNPGDRSNLHGNDAGFISMMDDLRPMVDGMPFSQIGFGGIILWNPNTDAEFVEADYKTRKVDVDLILAHEMYHAYDGMRGLLDRRFVKDDDLEFQPVCEYRAVRMENTLRKAFGYQYRRYYSFTEGDHRDMLDEKNEPIVIPTPCVNWL